MKKTIIALLLLFGSAFTIQYAYSTVLICIGTECELPSFRYVYTEQFQCYGIGEGEGYEICKYGEKNYFCLAMGDKNKQCVVIE